MLSSITPLGERSRNNRWGVTVAWYMAGSLLGGLSFGAALGGLGAAARSVWWPERTPFLLIVGAVLVAALLMDLGVGGELPSVHRQVNEDWLSLYRSWVYGGGFGYQLGLGVVTIVPTAGTYVAYAMAFLSGSLAGGALIGGVFGLTRALPILTVAHADDPRKLRSFHRAMQGLGSRAARLPVVGLAAGILVTTAATMGVL